MPNVISVTSRIARKKHQCNACLFLFDSDYRSMGASFSEYRDIAKAVLCNGKIYPGERYEEVAVEDCGAIGRFRQKPEIHKICLKYDLYYE